MLKTSNIGAQYAFSGDKAIKTFKKSETFKHIQQRTNHFLFYLYQKRKRNQMEDT